MICRVLGWLIAELLPAQAVRVARNRDYSDALNEYEAEHDGLPDAPVVPRSSTGQPPLTSPSRGRQGGEVDSGIPPPPTSPPLN